MALIQCSECKRQVSELAATCPGCGAPIADARSASATKTAVTVTEQTAKPFKAHQLIGLGLCVAGVIAIVGARPGDDRMPTVGGLLFIVGLVWFLVARIRAWWHHG